MNSQQLENHMRNVWLFRYATKVLLLSLAIAFLAYTIPLTIKLSLTARSNDKKPDIVLSPDNWRCTEQAMSLPVAGEYGVQVRCLRYDHVDLKRVR